MRFFGADRLKTSLDGNVVRGCLAVFGAFLIQFTVGAFHTTFGNLLPYFQSYKHQTDPTARVRDLAMILPAAGIVQGISYFLAGSLLVPLLGRRLTLFVGCAVYAGAPLVAYLTLDMPTHALAIGYGCVSGLAVHTVVIPNILIPVTWFPNSKGKVVGIVCSGFGLSSALFTPLQTYLINPENHVPELKYNSEHNTSDNIFSFPDLPNRFPQTLLYMTGMYSCMLAIGFLLCVEKKGDSDNSSGLAQIRDCLSYLYKRGIRQSSFYLLFITRMTAMVVIGGVLAHWKTFSLQLNSDDQQVSIVGGGNGVASAASRLVVGILLDRWMYRQVVPVFYGVLALCLISIYHVGRATFVGFMILMWMINLLTFIHFASIPTQTIKLFDSRYNSIVLGAIGFADTVAYAGVALLNYFIFTLTTSSQAFLWYFISLSVCACVAALSSVFVHESNNEEKQKKGNLEQALKSTSFSTKSS